MAFKIGDGFGDTGGIGTPEEAMAFRGVLGVVPQRKYLVGPDSAFQSFRRRLDDGQDAAAFFVGDSTFVDGNGLPKLFADNLAARYPNHRVELRRAASAMTSITKTVVQAGSSGRRYLYFPTGCQYGVSIPQTMATTSFVGAAALSWEAEVAFDAGSLNGSGWPTAAFTDLILCGTGGNKGGLFLNNDGKLYAAWTNSGGTQDAGPISSAAIPALTAGQVIRLRADIVADNAGSRNVRYYYSNDEGANWTEVGTVRTGAVTSFGFISATNNSYYLGGAGATPTLTGVKYYHAQALVGTNRLPVLPERMDMWSHATGQTTNCTEIGGSPTIFIDQCAQNGATIAVDGFFTGTGSGDLTTEAYRCLVNHAPDFIALNSSHNDTSCPLPVDWETRMDAAGTSARALFAHDPAIVHTTQNPEPLDYGDGGLSRQHNMRQAWILQYAAKNGRACTDIYQAFLDANDAANSQAGNVHPSAAGYTLWGNAFFDCFLSGTNEPQVL